MIKNIKLGNNITEYETIENEINAYWEGELGQVTITTHERNINARNKCIQSKGTKCFVCGFDFEKTYGELGKGFIHIRHVTPISNRDGRYEIEVENDLFPVCPNCHARIHRLGIPFNELVPNHVSWETLLDSYQEAK